MVTEIGGHKLELYDSIDEMPVVRWHRYQKLLLIDAGVGADIAAFDIRAEKIRQYILAGQGDKAIRELDNLRQGVWMVQNGISPRHKAFAVLIRAVDGREVTAEEAERVCGELAEGEVTVRLEAVKKKIDGELTLYFPRLFETSEIKEYYDLLRKRTLEILDGISRGEPVPESGLTGKLLTFADPRVFTGSDGEEVRFDRNFEDTCLMLSEHLHVKPKELTVLEFYNAFDYLQERAREAQRKRK